MHLQQTKRSSLATGGAQYYFHNLTDDVKNYLRKKNAVSVALVTPYGATITDYIAVDTEHKLDKSFRPIPGCVGHDRIQQGKASESIGEAIRTWYQLQDGDFERIDVDIEVRDDAFYLTPVKYRFAGNKKISPIPRNRNPLSFTHEFQSPLWIQQFGHIERENAKILPWIGNELKRIVHAHLPKSKLAHIQETDILRASGPLKHLGVAIGGYVGKGYDCATQFDFLFYPSYSIPVEIKRYSAGFKYQEQKYGKSELSRAVILCALHTHKNLPPHIDVIELDAMAQYIQRNWQA